MSCSYYLLARFPPCFLTHPPTRPPTRSCLPQIKPDVQTVGMGMAASQGALLLAAGAKGKRFAMPNTRIMIHQPQGGCGVREGGEKV